MFEFIKNLFGINKVSRLRYDLPESIQVVKILEINKHPNADRLNLVTVTDGQTQLPQIVCGAQNINVGDFVPLARLGTILKVNENENFEIKQATIRGEESNGMLCSQKELGIGDDHEGIFILKNADEFIGKTLNEYLNRN